MRARAPWARRRFDGADEQAHSDALARVTLDNVHVVEEQAVKALGENGGRHLVGHQPAQSGPRDVRVVLPPVGPETETVGQRGVRPRAGPLDGSHVEIAQDQAPWARRAATCPAVASEPSHNRGIAASGRLSGYRSRWPGRSCAQRPGACREGVRCPPCSAGQRHSPWRRRGSGSRPRAGGAPWVAHRPPGPGRRAHAWLEVGARWLLETPLLGLPDVDESPSTFTRSCQGWPPRC